MFCLSLISHKYQRLQWWSANLNALSSSSKITLSWNLGDEIEEALASTKTLARRHLIRCQYQFDQFENTQWRKVKQTQQCGGTRVNHQETCLATWHLYQTSKRVDNGEHVFTIYIENSFWDAIAFPCSYPVSGWVGWLSDSFRCDAIASSGFASLFFFNFT